MRIKKQDECKGRGKRESEDDNHLEEGKRNNVKEGS